MPRKTLGFAKPSDSLSLVPSPSQTPVRITKRTLAKFQQQQFLENTPAMLEALYPALVKGMKDGNPKILELVTQIQSLTAPSKGITLVNTINNANSNRAESGGSERRSFESLVRKLDGRDVIDVKAV